jgi:nucleoid DNA-binding protein
MSVSKRDISVAVAEKTNLKQAEARLVVQATLDYISEQLVAGRTVELRNFGVFEIVTRKKRIGRNPNKPEINIVVPARSVVKFRAGQKLRKQVEKLK